MKPLLPLFLLFIIFSCKPKDQATEELTIPVDTTKVEVSNVPGIELLWKSDVTLTTAESVYFDKANNLYYVSCINGIPPEKKDKDGFISRVRLDGQIADLKWVTGLSAPKGMGMVGTTLYVTDIDRLVAIDVTKGTILKEWPVKGAQFLNDVVVTSDNRIYFTDTNTNTIHELVDDKVVTVVADPTLGGPNGLCFDGGILYIPGMMSGEVKTVDPATKKIELYVSGIPGGDGIERYGNGFLVSNWNGEVYYVDQDKKVTKIIDTKEAKLNAADIELDVDRSIMLVPTFFGNNVMAYGLKAEVN